MSMTVRRPTHAMSASSISEAVQGKYIVVDGHVHVITALYGPKILCTRVDDHDQALPNTYVLELAVGSVLLDEHPGLTQTDDAAATAGPTPREFAHAIQKLADEEEEPIGLREIANFLEYSYDATQRRAARLMRDLPPGLIAVERVGRTNYYAVNDAVALSAYLRGNA